MAYLRSLLLAAWAFPRNASVGLEQTTENKDFEESNALFVDSTFHKLLTTQTLLDNPGDALNNRSSVVLTDEAAEKYFGATELVIPVISFIVYLGENGRITLVVLSIQARLSTWLADFQPYYWFGARRPAFS